MNKLFAITIGSLLFIVGTLLFSSQSEIVTSFALGIDTIPVPTHQETYNPQLTTPTSQKESHNPSLFCGQASAWEQALQADSDLRRKQELFETALYQKALRGRQAASSRGALPPPYELPVVVHVIHDGGPENISLAQIQAGIEHLNDAFANRGYYDQGTGVDTRIQFCLAIRNPDGNVTNGINRVQSTLTEMNKETDDLAVKNLVRWNPEQYINIWLVKEICSSSTGCGVAGYAYFPSAHG